MGHDGHGVFVNLAKGLGCKYPFRGAVGNDAALFEKNQTIAIQGG